MGRLFIETLSGARIFKCKCCKVDSASHDDIVSKDFQGRFGRAYLFRNAVNIILGPTEERMLSSGLHTVNDIYCSSCQQILGWKYVSFFSCPMQYSFPFLRRLMRRAKSIKKECSFLKRNGCSRRAGDNALGTTTRRRYFRLS
ncbi:hypothetical protein SCA6_020532 [Theobroma cacao]